MPKIKRADLIWAAGLFDGEGCISLSQRSPQRFNGAINYNYTVILKVTMCHRPTVERLHRMFGAGTIHRQRVQKSHYSRPWIWFCNRTNAEFVLRQIRPWLFTKASEADLAMEFFALPLMEKGGRWGSRPVSRELEAKRRRLFIQLRDCKSRNVSAKRRVRSEGQISRQEI